jgi:RimJ/RimL family protein N-acetyltransferase
MIRFARARVEDAKALALISWQAFDNDVHYGAPGPGGPPGYRSDRWQSKMMRIGKYYKVLVDNRIIGGFIVFDQGNGHYELGRIFIAPDFQNRGIGAQAFEFMWTEFPAARRWTLGTPAWNLRTRHFYKKVGFVEVGQDGPDGVRFERRMDYPAQAEHTFMEETI